MSAALLVNGVAVDPDHAVAANDRGLSYGDGLFETMLLRNGSVRFLDAHLARLRQGCGRLAISYPGDALLGEEIRAVIGDAQQGVVKIIVTRGQGGRGYRPPDAVNATRVVSLHPEPEAAEAGGIRIRTCETRLARNPLLAGMKHLCRLEQVLARSEWNDSDIAEGLMLDTEGELICGTSSNVFVVRNNVLTTPDLRFCGIHGVMRAQVLCAARDSSMQTAEEPLWPEDLSTATEVFLTNAVRGIRSVVACESLRWKVGPVAGLLKQVLES